MWPLARTSKANGNYPPARALPVNSTKRVDSITSIMLGSVTTWLKRPEMIRFKDKHICEKQIETIEKKEDGWYWLSPITTGIGRRSTIAHFAEIN